MSETLRQPAEVRYAAELAALAAVDEGPRPRAWRLSPRMVLRYVVGSAEPVTVGSGKKAQKVPITRKFFGDDSVVERAIVTLASERALLLVGEPGTGKSWLSEHLAAAISGCSTLTVQGTAGTTEEHLKYSWNVARVIAEGATAQNLVPSPTMLAMRTGSLLRFEEITRCVPDVQDALVSVLSDKAIAVPELPDANMVWAVPGFNVIATANTRDQGVNDLSAALKRRFNYVYLPVVGDRITAPPPRRSAIPKGSSNPPPAPSGLRSHLRRPTRPLRSDHRPRESRPPRSSGAAVTLPAAAVAVPTSARSQRAPLPQPVETPAVGVAEVRLDSEPWRERISGHGRAIPLE